MIPFRQRMLKYGGGAAFGAGAYAYYDSLRQYTVKAPPAKSYPVKQLMSDSHGQVVLPTWEPPTRAQNLQQLGDEEFDILIIGGGATGTGCAMDAATRGLKVALVERDDFAAGTSSRSTKLIHGGIRYLAQAFQSKIPPQSLWDVFANFRYDDEYMKIVSADLAERAFMIQSAPFMTRPIPMMIPLYKWWEVPMMYATGQLYDMIAGRRQSVPPSHFVPAAEAQYQFPALQDRDEDGNRLQGCMVVYDGQQNDTRMNLHIALTAVQSGAVAVNHCPVESLSSEGTLGEEDYKITGAHVLDALTGQKIHVRAKQVINACGVFSDTVRKMADPKVPNIMIAGPGTHLVMPDYASPAAMGLVWFTKDGRVLYLLPWEGQTIAGTTDSPGDVTFSPCTTDGEVNFILNECNRVLKDKVDKRTVRAAWAGLRPLVRDPNADPADTKKLSRDHVVDLVAGNLITIAGGKWTTYRKMAEDAVDAAVRTNADVRAHATSECVTHHMKLIGADRGNLVCHQNFDKVSISLREQFDMDKDIAEHLCSNYGTRALQLAAMGISEPDGRIRSKADTGHGRRFWKRLVPQHPMLEAEVVFAVRNEYAQTAVDVLGRRTRLSFVDVKAALESLPRVLALMQEELQWDEARVDKERADTLEFLDTMYLPTRGIEGDKELKDRILY